MRIGAPVQTVQGTLLLMRSLRFAEFGPPSVLQIEEVPIPEPGEAEALVHVKAAAINPSDIADVSGRFRNTTLPRTPGRDFAGVVVKGKQHEGEEVWGSAPKLGIVRDGSHAEYVVVPAETLSPKPKSLSMAQAAAIGVPYITAWAWAGPYGVVPVFYSIFVLDLKWIKWETKGNGEQAAEAEPTT